MIGDVVIKHWRGWQVGFLALLLIFCWCSVVQPVGAIPPMGTLANAATNLSISTYDGSGQETHPCVIYSLTPWNGYHYLMVETPYPNTTDSYENPSMRYSNDKMTWVQIAGQPDPIVNKPSIGFLSDPNIALNGSTLYLFYRYADSNITPTIIYYNYTTTTDGVTWTTPVLTNMNGTRSSSFLWNGTMWESWGHNTTSGNLTHFSSATLTGWTGTGNASGINIGAYSQWHSEVKLYDGQYEMLLLPTSYDRLFYFNSTDGISWTGSDKNPVMLGNGTNHWDQMLYKSSFIEVNNTFDVWYAGWKAATPDVWHVGYTSSNKQLIPDFVGTPLSGSSPLSVSFSDLSSGAVSTWSWFFGDENYTQPWILKNSSAGWSGRYGHRSVSFPNGDMVIVGGYDLLGTHYKNDTWRSTDGGITWINLTTGNGPGWYSRSLFGLVTLSDGTMRLFGGRTATGNTNDVWKSTDEGITWSNITITPGWSPRRGFGYALLSDGSIVVSGGYDGSTLYNDTWRSTDGGSTWSLMSSSGGWTGRVYPYMTSVNGSLVVSGGFDLTSYYNDTWSSSDNGATWIKQNTSSGFAPRSNGQLLTMPDNSIILMGGVGTTYYNDIWRSIDTGKTWSVVNISAGWSPRNQFAASVINDGSIMVFGGLNGTGDYKHDVWKFSPAGSNLQNPVHQYVTPGNYSVSEMVTGAFGSNTLTKVNYINVSSPPTPVASFTGTPTSGVDPLTVTFTDASTGSPTGWAWFFGDEQYTQPWVNLTSSAGWSGRRFAASVITSNGTIVVMGGDASGSYRNDVWGSINNGSTWNQITSSAWPVGRRGEGAVYVDNTIVIMGGQDNNNVYLNDVWQSITNGSSWTRKTTTPGWGNRSNFASFALSDGSIVIFGGANGTIKSNDTWRSTDDGATWTNITATGALTPRSLSGYATLQDQSIVLVGGNDGGYKNDVWRSTDKGADWTLLNSNPGFSGRQGSVVSTMPDGSLILMGEYNSGTYLSDVWRSVDNGVTWKLLNSTGLFGGGNRAYFTSVVIPNGSLISMGGYDGSGNYKNDVWQFSPQGSNAQNPTHTYTTYANQTWNVAETVYNSAGYNTTLKQVYVTANRSYGTAAFSGNPLSGRTPVSISFSDASTGSPSQYTYYFGDENYTQPWTNITGSPGWAGRYGFGAATVPNGDIIITGGKVVLPSTQEQYFNDTWRSSDGGVTWGRQSANPAWVAREFCPLVELPDGSIVLMGGTGSASTGSVPLNDTWRSTDEGKTWTEMNASGGWAPADGSSATVMANGDIVLMGGATDGGLFYNYTWKSSDGGAHWTQQTSSAPWAAREHFKAPTMPDQSIVLIGGEYNGVPRIWYNDSWRSTDEGVTWTNITGSPGWQARGTENSIALLPDESLVVIAGGNPITGNDNLFNDTWRSSDDGVTWAEINATNSWIARSSDSVVTMPDGSIVMMGGVGGDSQNPLNDTWRLSPQGSNLQNPVHQYVNPGSATALYNVSEMVTGAFGSNTLTKSLYITEYPATPNATSFLSRNTVKVPSYVWFNDTSSVTTAWNWSFGDGQYAATANGSHVCTRRGIYNVSTNVSNTGGYNFSFNILRCI